MATEQSLARPRPHAATQPGSPAPPASLPGNLPGPSRCGGASPTGWKGRGPGPPTPGALGGRSRSWGPPGFPGVSLPAGGSQEVSASGRKRASVIKGLAVSRRRKPQGSLCQLTLNCSSDAISTAWPPCMSGACARSLEAS